MILLLMGRAAKRQQQNVFYASVGQLYVPRMRFYHIEKLSKTVP